MHKILLVVCAALLLVAGCCNTCWGKELQEEVYVLENTSPLEPLVDGAVDYHNTTFTNVTQQACRSEECEVQTAYLEKAARLAYVHDVLVQDALRGMIDASGRISDGLTRYKETKTPALRLQVEQGFTDMQRYCDLLDRALDELTNATGREEYWEYAGLDLVPLQERARIIRESIEEPCTQTMKALHDIETWKAAGQSGLPSYLSI